MPLLTEEQHGEAIKEALESGASYRKLSKALGVNRDTLVRFLKRYHPDWHEAHKGAYATDGVVADPPTLKILIIDIETRPNLAYVWDVWNTNVPPAMIIDEKDVICFAAKWYGEKDVEFYSTFGDGRERMVAQAHRLLDEADMVIHYNGKKFDVPHLNLEFLRGGLTPPSPYRQVDLLQTMRREFKFTHNKLDHVANKLGIGSKTEHEGFGLWLKCMQGDADAWMRMAEYNINDVLLTEELYTIVKPWIQNHPSYAAIFGDTRCPNCGSQDLAKNGRHFTKTSTYQRYVCKNCGAYCRDTHNTTRSPVTSTGAW